MIELIREMFSYHFMTRAIIVVHIYIDHKIV